MGVLYVYNKTGKVVVKRVHFLLTKLPSENLKLGHDY